MAHVTAGGDHGTCVMSYLVAHVPSLVPRGGREVPPLEGLGTRLGICHATFGLYLTGTFAMRIAHAIHVDACAVLLLVGWSINLYTTRGRLPSC